MQSKGLTLLFLQCFLCAVCCLSWTSGNIANVPNIYYKECGRLGIYNLADQTGSRSAVFVQAGSTTQTTTYSNMDPTFAFWGDPYGGSTPNKITVNDGTGIDNVNIQVSYTDTNCGTQNYLYLEGQTSAIPSAVSSMTIDIRKWLIVYFNVVDETGYFSNFSQFYILNGVDLGSGSVQVRTRMNIPASPCTGTSCYCSGTNLTECNYWVLAWGYYSICAPPLASCDTNPDCETNLSTSTTNCGSCGTNCNNNVLQATGKSCSSGLCNYTSCNSGFGDCDAVRTNGCEQAINTITRCGNCTNNCSTLPNTKTVACNAGSCSIIECQDGYLNCDGIVSNGCEASNTSTTSCGGCSKNCLNIANTTAPYSCSSGICSFGCPGGTGNCDSIDTNGCENPLNTVAYCGSCTTTCAAQAGSNQDAQCVSGNCQYPCQTGWKDCTGALGCETNITTTTNCGDCNVNCATTFPNSQTACSSNVCVFLGCIDPYGDCTPAAGCETNLQTSTTHCGTCPTDCTLIPHADVTCNAGNCAITSCQGTWKDCDSNPLTCETDTSNNLSHCSACNKSCTFTNGVPLCQNSICSLDDCVFGFENCNGNSTDGCETDVKQIPNCGVCGEACILPQATGTCNTTTLQCQVLTCNSGFGDCNANPGCETNLNTSLQNCGNCSNTCAAVSNGTPKCVNGVCGMDCSPGYGNCDGIYGNGCETQLNTPTHCNGCNVTCQLNNSVTKCTNYVCEIASCNINFGNCDNTTSNGCEVNHLTDNTYCGDCSTKCQAVANGASTCVSGVCQTTCTPPFKNCDSNPSDCESNSSNDVNHCGSCSACTPVANTTVVCTNSACVYSCINPHKDCNNNMSDFCEVDVSSNANNCASCNTKCNLTNVSPQTCSASTCIVNNNCVSPWLDCNKVDSDGCEINSSNNLQHCGVCNKTCSSNNGNPTCSSGTCTINCNSGYQNCDGNAQSNGCEINILTDVNHCGNCSTVCNQYSTCNNGVCEITSCPSTDLRDCNNNATDICEINITNDANNCAECNTKCNLTNVSPQTCSASTCIVNNKCVSPWLDCNKVDSDGCEINSLTDLQHCGICNKTCSSNNGNPTCSSGTCTINCNSGYQNCDGNAQSNGCEINILTDINHCGNCSTVCNLNNVNPQTCMGGVCIVNANCVPYFADCNRNDTDGCEVDTLTSMSHCGGCSKPCILPHATSICVNGTCLISVCDTNYLDCDGSPSNGCEVYSQNDTLHCGGCKIACSVSNGAPICETGECKVKTCNSPYSDCNSVYSDGCETNLYTDNLQCGVCGKACSLPHTQTTSCNLGTCKVEVCTAPFLNCDGNSANGCEIYPLNDTLNCNQCGNECDLPFANQKCSNRQCVIGSCISNYADCNGVVEDGCESNLGSDEHCGVCSNNCTQYSFNGVTKCLGSSCKIERCFPGFSDCDRDYRNGCEINLITDVNNCGVCSNQCKYLNAKANCTDGLCNLEECNEWFGNCDTRLTNGCEMPLNSTQHCGQCNFTCSIESAISECSSHECDIQNCVAGFGDCDGNIANGCETQVNTVTNCGSCRNSCNLPNAIPSCATGTLTCTVSSCLPGFGNCNRDSTDGCEIAFNTTNNCGGCNILCPNYANSVSTCANGVCELAYCSKPNEFLDCNNVLKDGCETSILTDKNNCGSCGTTCSLANSLSGCNNGSCEVLQCKKLYGNCDADHSNGCETALTSLEHCAACNNPCSLFNAFSNCTTGICLVEECYPNWDNCDRTDANGCENDLNSMQHCGACNAACSITNAESACSDRICSLVQCLGQYRNCDGTIENGCETRVSSDVLNCGECNNECDLPNAVPFCDEGACFVARCLNGFGNCNGITADGCEVNTNEDILHCGECGNVCPFSETANLACIRGNCSVLSCKEGYSQCGLITDGCTIDLMNDAENCGSCGNFCITQNGNSSCIEGVCVITECSEGFADCDGEYANGCETNLVIDLFNCGECGNVCYDPIGIPLCTDSKCAVTCIKGYAQCGGVSEDGSVCQSLSSNANCGACGVVCSFPNAIPACEITRQGAECVIQECEKGFLDEDGIVSNGCELPIITSNPNDDGTENVTLPSPCPTPSPSKSPVGSLNLLAPIDVSYQYNLGQQGQQTANNYYIPKQQDSNGGPPPGESNNKLVASSNLSFGATIIGATLMSCAIMFAMVFGLTANYSTQKKQDFLVNVIENQSIAMDTMGGDVIISPIFDTTPPPESSS